MADITLTVHEDAPVALHYVEAKIKPEQTKDVTPGWEPVTVTPDEGCVLSQVNVAGMPEPTEVVEISTNGDYNVARKGVARVNVQPVLETATVTPTEQQQVVTAVEGDGLSAVTVEPIPGQYIIPSGKVTLTKNATDVPIEQYATADVAVPVPVMPEEYALGGSIADFSATGYYVKRGVTSIGANAFQGYANFETINIPDTVTLIGESAFKGCTNLELTRLPQALNRIGKNAFWNCYKISVKEVPSGITSINDNIFAYCYGITELTFLGNISEIAGGAFHTCSNCLLYYFKNITSVPTLKNYDAFRNINANAKIVVPDSLVTSCKTATNWVTYANYIVGVSEYENS